MRCDDCRKAIAADPVAPGPEALRHVRECAACAGQLNEFQTLNRQIARALEIEVPELRMPELPGVEGNNSGTVVGLRGRRRKGAKVWKRASVLVGLAAGIAVFSLVALLSTGTDWTAQSLAEEVIAHMDHEQASRQVTSVAVPARKLDAVVKPAVSRLGEEVGLVSYAASCVIAGNRVPHLVVQGDRGPITLILLPDRQIDAPVPLSGVHVYGLLLPAGHGSIAVIGEREDQLEEVEETGRRLAATVKWRI